MEKKKPTTMDEKKPEPKKDLKTFNVVLITVLCCVMVALLVFVVFGLR